MSEPKILVCGAGGYIGGKLIASLLARGHKNIRAASSRPIGKWLKSFDSVENSQCDLGGVFACREMMEGVSIVYNLAAKVGGIGYISANKTECLLSSQITTNLLIAAEKSRVMRFFQASSSCVYPESVLPLKEHEAKLFPTLAYAQEKLFGEQMCLAFAEERNVPVSIARIHGLYGPGDVRQAGKDHVAAAMCLKVINAKLSGQHEINIWGDGNQTRSFLYIDDAIEGIYRLTNAGVQGPVNLANSEVVSVNQIVSILEDIAAIRLKRFYSADAPVGCQHKTSDNTLLRESLNWEPMTPIRDGLEAMYRDFWDRAVLGKKIFCGSLGREVIEK